MWRPSTKALRLAACALILFAVAACGESTSNTSEKNNSKASASPESTRTRLVPVASERHGESPTSAEAIDGSPQRTEGSTDRRGSETPSSVAAFGSSGADTATGSDALHYAGTATTTIDYLDPSGQSQGSYVYETGAFVEVKEPASAGGLTESNPINLFLAAGDPSSEGSLEIHSAIPFTDPTDGQAFLAEYWDITVNGSAVEGRLVDPHTAEALTINLVNAGKEVAPGIPPMVWPYAMGTNTTLNGTIDANTVTLHIEGNSVDETRPFVSEIVANRQ